MKKFVVDEIHKRSGDEFRVGIFENKEDAIKAARHEWACWCDSDRNNNDIEIRKCEMVYDEYEEDYLPSYDSYDCVEWRPTYLVTDKSGAEIIKTTDLDDVCAKLTELIIDTDDHDLSNYTMIDTVTGDSKFIYWHAGEEEVKAEA